MYSRPPPCNPRNGTRPPSAPSTAATDRTGTNHKDKAPRTYSMKLSPPHNLTPPHPTPRAHTARRPLSLPRRVPSPPSPPTPAQPYKDQATESRARMRASAQSTNSSNRAAENRLAVREAINPWRASSRRTTKAWELRTPPEPGAGPPAPLFCPPAPRFSFFFRPAGPSWVA